MEEDKIDFLLNRAVSNIYPTKEDLKKVLMSGKKLRLYQGFDPTGDKLHIGHMVGLRKHKQWQELGHEVIFLIGDGTGQAGDPTGKKKTREKFFTNAELRANAETYIKQASRIIDFGGPNPIKVMYNGDWLNKLSLPDVLNIAGNFSAGRMMERDMFQERIKNGLEINLREFLYPVLQAYDSVAMDVDLEIGGTDQTFNMLSGRSLMKKMKAKEKFVMTLPILADSKGVKIGKSEGNVMALTEEPFELFSKIMTLGDDSTLSLFELLTDVSMEEIKSFDIKKNPFELKKRVAFLIVEQLNNTELALQAKEKFEDTFSKGEFPQNAQIIITNKENKIVDILIENKILDSKSDWRRLIEAGAVLDHPDKKITNPNELVGDRERKLKIGKKIFIVINPK